MSHRPLAEPDPPRRSWSVYQYTWRAIGLLGGLYGVAAFFLQRGLSGDRRFLWLVAAGVSTVVLGAVVAFGPSSASDWTRRPSESIVQVYEGSGGTVSVVMRRTPSWRL